MKKFGFTLAEVLITLGIIGIVAALTIPVLMQNIQDQQFKTAWKKEYSVLNQAVQSYLNDNSTTFLGVQNYANVLKPYLKVVQYCDTHASVQGCWVPSGQNLLLQPVSGSKTGYVPTASGTTDLGINYGLILPDGTTISTKDDWRAGCSAYGFVCGWILVDVNGFKAPNTISKDIFGVWVLQDRVIPIGASSDPSIYNSACAASGGTGTPAKTGWGCSAEYLYK